MVGGRLGLYAAVSANVAPEVQEQIDAIATEMQVSRADVVRMLLREALAARERSRQEAEGSV